ncbi:MAG: rod shape-determining protein MreC [Clostridiales bacterium]|nr:rod shape-determining protein MreC [Clostridiales bacterium]MCD8050527.1 rod shape-determining protein MreC [Clostridiales bacterium]
MKKFFHDNGLWVLIAALLLTAVVTMTSALFPNMTSPLSNVIGVVSSPFQRVASSFTGWVEGVYDYAFRYEQLVEENEALQQELSEVRSELREAQDAQAENEDLRNALGLVEEKTDLTLMDVTVTEGKASSWESTLTISKGSNAGIAVNDVVITGTGYLVGVVQEVGTNWATLITILDPSISVSATVYRTGDTLMLESDLSLMTEGKCKLTYLSADAVFISGDEVLTSGANGTYPSGLVVGYIESVETEPSGLERYAVVTPAADFDNLSTLFVVTDFNND